MAELFSGIGGWSEAARMAGGIKPIWHSEIDKKKIEIYEKRHPGVPNLGDIRNIESPPWADIFTVSFPCSDISACGKGAGIEGNDSRMWFEAERLIGQVRPGYVIIENSPMLTVRGLHIILGSLASFGYNAEWTRLQGTQFGIQQLRKRLYLIAYANKERCEGIRVPIFRRINKQVEKGNVSTQCVSPGWRTRREIPQPRTYRSTHDIPGGVHRLEGTGDAIIPLIGCYILQCIKKHYAEILCH